MRPRFFIDQQSARGKSARYAREWSFARCHDEAGAIILHGSAADNTSRTGRSTSSAAHLKSYRLWQNCELSIESKKTKGCCTQHAPDAMVDVKSR